VHFAVHVLAALWALAWLGGLPPVRLGEALVSSGAAGYVIGAIGMVWVLNLFNFMDGIDGLAASEGVFRRLGRGTGCCTRAWRRRRVAASRGRRCRRLRLSAVELAAGQDLHG
jgi:UDP-N-acetylmuramyl pentapeptide phosphotransferase/UDP-N-acetylglucosamine-1-phosphate transferase